MRPHHYWIVYYAIAVHYCWAVAIYLVPSAYHIAALGELSRLGLGARHASLMLLAVATCALFGALFDRNYLCRLGLFPQQFLLVISAGGALSCVLRGSYADGTLRPMAFIAADQSPAILIAVFHTFALLEIYGGWSWRGRGYRLQR